jgi:hypothetical protein
MAAVGGLPVVSWVTRPGPPQGGAVVARLIDNGRSLPDPRPALVAKWREMGERYSTRWIITDDGHRVGVTDTDDGFYGEPWSIDADRLEAGEPVKIHAWQLPKQFRPDGCRTDDRIRLEGDGLVVIVKAARPTSSPGRREPSTHDDRRDSPPQEVFDLAGPQKLREATVKAPL